MKEIWKEVPVNSSYEASNLGNVRSKKRVDCIGRHRKSVVRKPGIIFGGYRQITLYTNRKRTLYLVHHIIALTFLGSPGKIARNGWQINHKNGIKFDNRVENLEWCTASQNHIHASNFGLKPRGERAHFTKLTKEKVLKIRDSYPTKNLYQLAEEYGVSATAVMYIIHRKNWKHI